MEEEEKFEFIYFPNFFNRNRLIIVKYTNSISLLEHISHKARLDKLEGHEDYGVF